MITIGNNNYLNYWQTCKAYALSENTSLNATAHSILDCAQILAIYKSHVSSISLQIPLVP